MLSTIISLISIGLGLTQIWFGPSTARGSTNTMSGAWFHEFACTKQSLKYGCWKIQPKEQEKIPFQLGIYAKALFGSPSSTQKF